MSNLFRKVNATLAATALATSTVLSSGMAFAFTNGTLGSTSTGSIGISLTKANQVRITGIAADFSTTSWSITDGAVNYNTNVCIYASNGTYTVKGTSLNGAAGVFNLKHSSDLIPYTVTWNDAGSGTGALATEGSTVLTESSTSATLSNAANDSDTCAVTGTGVTARIDIDITAAALIAVPAATYTDTLTLLITPV